MKLTIFDIPMMNWLNGQSKRDPPLTALTPIFIYDLLSFNCGFTLNSQRLTSFFLVQKSALAMNNKQPMVMFLHNQRLQTSDIQAFNFQHFLLTWTEKEAREYNWHNKIPTRTGIYLPLAFQIFVPLVIPTVRFFNQKVPRHLEAMAAAGRWHTVLLRSDGQAVACGWNSDGQCNIPPLNEGISYTQAAAGEFHTVLLRSDGQAVACGSKPEGQCDIPPLDEGLSYTQVSARRLHTVLLRSDGQAVACGANFHGQCSIPPLDEGLSYSQVSAGRWHTVLLRSDGQAVACGWNSDGQCNIPPLDEGLSYIQVSAGEFHTVLLRSDGQAVAYGSNRERQCSIPPLDEGLSYIQVSAGEFHTVLLRSDGQAVAYGRNREGQCSIPPLDEGLSYIQVSAGDSNTVLLRSDGQAVTCSKSRKSKCNIPSLRSSGSASPSVSYVCHFTFLPMLRKDRVVQVDFLFEDDASVILTCVGLDGLEVLRLKAQKSERTVDVCSRVARELKTNPQNLRLVLPDARLLGAISKANPFATLSDVISA